MLPIKRGAFSPNAGTGDKAFKQSIANEKFVVPKNELQMEEFLKNITPRNAVKQKAVKKFIRNKMNTLSKLVANSGSDRALHTSELNAWGMWLTNLEAEQLEGKEDHQFTIDFYAWLRGRGGDREHDMTPWGRQRIEDPEVKAYLMSFVDAKFDFLEAIQKLVYKANWGGGLDGIAEHYIYYKYIIRGGWKDRSSAEFLHDYNKYFGWEKDINKEWIERSIIDKKRVPQF
jgi:hypothetical protein